MKEQTSILIDKDLLKISKLYAIQVRKHRVYDEYVQELITIDLKNISMQGSSIMKQLGVNVSEFLNKRS
jgi:hypothetical protein